MNWLDDNYYKKGIEAGQDVFDVALQEYGDIALMFKVLIDNGDKISALTDTITPASMFRFRKNIDVPKPEVRRWFVEQKQIVNTRNDSELENFLLQENGDLILQENAGGILINQNSNDAQSTYIGITDGDYPDA